MLREPLGFRPLLLKSRSAEGKFLDHPETSSASTLKRFSGAVTLLPDRGGFSIPNFGNKLQLLNAQAVLVKPNMLHPVRRLHLVMLSHRSLITTTLRKQLLRRTMWHY